VRLKLRTNTGSAQGVASASEAVMKAAAQGEITTQKALQLASVLEIRRKAIEASEVEARLRALERVVLPRERGRGLQRTDPEMRPLRSQFASTDSSPARTAVNNGNRRCPEGSGEMALPHWRYQTRGTLPGDGRKSIALPPPHASEGGPLLRTNGVLLPRAYVE
jgi:hypothetical protein